MCGDEESGYSAELTHEPVMLKEVLEHLDLQPGKVIVDCTLGGGGHAIEICRRIGDTGRLIGIEQDIDGLNRAKQRLAGYPVTFIHDNFRNLDNILNSLQLEKVDGFLFDLGVSSFQFDKGERGFSFRFDAPLDMRMDQRSSITAADLVNRMSEEELTAIFIESGYVGRWARNLARAIHASRHQSQLNTTAQFAELVKANVPAKHHSKLHPATLAFQALRIRVNSEIEVLSEALLAAIRHSNIHARIIVISYHSLEDGETKRTFHLYSGKTRPPSDPFNIDPPVVKLVNILTKKPLVPSFEETRKNPRSRSAKFRVVERTDVPFK